MDRMFEGMEHSKLASFLSNNCMNHHFHLSSSSAQHQLFLKLKPLWWRIRLWVRCSKRRLACRVVRSFFKGWLMII